MTEEIREDLYEEKLREEREDPYHSLIQAKLSSRFLAYIIDMALGLAISNILLSFFHLPKPVFRALRSLVVMSYFFLSTYYLKGQSLGKLLLNLRVAKLDGKEPDMKTCFFREVISRYIQNKIPFLYLLSAFLPLNQNIGDLVSDSYVIDMKVEKIIREREERERSSFEEETIS